MADGPAKDEVILADGPGVAGFGRLIALRLDESLLAGS